MRQPSQGRVVLAQSCFCCEAGGREEDGGKQRKLWGEGCGASSSHMFPRAPWSKACFRLTLSAHTGWTHQAENPSSQLTSPVTLTPSRICLYEIVNY